MASNYYSGGTGSQTGEQGTTHKMRISDLRPRGPDAVYGHDNILEFRVVYKSPINLEGRNKPFCFHAFDGSQSIPCVSVRDETDRFFHAIQINKTYQMRSFGVHPQHPKYGEGFSHGLEIWTNDKTAICPITLPDFPKGDFGFLDVAAARKLSPGALLNILAVISKVGMRSQSAKTGKSGQDFRLMDQTGREMPLLVWDDAGVGVPSLEGGAVVALLKVKKLEFAGVDTLSAGLWTAVWVDPDLAEARVLAEWYEHGRNSLSR